MNDLSLMMWRRWGKVGYPTCTVSTSRAGNFTPSCSPRAEGTKHTHTHAHTRLARAFIMTHQDARAAAEHCTRQTRTWVTDLLSSRCALGKKRHGRRILFSRFQQSGVFLHGELGLTPSSPLYSLSQRNQNRKSNADVLFWKIIVKKKSCDCLPRASTYVFLVM